MFNALKNIIGGTFEDLEEAVVEPVKDQVGQALEQAVQTKPLTPMQKQQKVQAEQDRQVRLSKTRQWFENLAKAQVKVREQNKQKENMRLQAEEEQQQTEEQERQVKSQSRREQLVTQAQKNEMAEIKPGRGHA